MRLVSYRDQSRLVTGIVVDDVVFGLQSFLTGAGLPADASFPELMRADTRMLERIAAATLSERVGGLADVSLGPAVVRPDKVICVGLNYQEHAHETDLELPSVPMLFAKFANSLVGPREPVRIPPGTDQVDYEAELAVVIGRTARSVEVGAALDHVAGLTCFNDVSARDWQMETSQFIAGKAFETAGPCGPMLVTLDEVGDPQRLELTARLNGRVVQQSNTSNMIFGVAELVAFISTRICLEPGDIISTGTPAGIGMTQDPPVFLRPGDQIEVEIEGLGRLCNPVEASST